MYIPKTKINKTQLSWAFITLFSTLFPITCWSSKNEEFIYSVETGMQRNVPLVEPITTQLSWAFTITTPPLTLFLVYLLPAEVEVAEVEVTGAGTAQRKVKVPGTRSFDVSQTSPVAQSVSLKQHPPTELPSIMHPHPPVEVQTVLPGHPKPPATVIYW